MATNVYSVTRGGTIYYRIVKEERAGTGDTIAFRHVYGRREKDYQEVNTVVKRMDAKEVPEDTAKFLLNILE